MTETAEGFDMIIKRLFTKTILPLTLIWLLYTMFLPVCSERGEVDYFLLWILVGCPFGIKKMWAWLVPSGFDLSGTVGVLALNFILGGLIGGFVVIVRIIQAIYNVFWCILWCIAKEPEAVRN